MKVICDHFPAKLDFSNKPLFLVENCLKSKDLDYKIYVRDSIHDFEQMDYDL